jgi:hypothetical protein
LPILGSSLYAGIMHETLAIMKTTLIVTFVLFSQFGGEHTWPLDGKYQNIGYPKFQ